MIDFIVRFVAVGTVMGVLDGLWLTVVANKFYKSQIGKLLLDKPNMTAALLFYAIYVVGVVLFVLTPALERGSVKYAILYGAAFGSVAYATYDLTNLATLKGWTTKLVVVDIVWGAVLTATVAAVAYWAVSSWRS